MMDPILSMIGICRKAGRIEAGEEPVDAAVRARDARLLLLAADAADNTARRCAHFAEVGQCLWLRIPESKYELGRALGRGSCAVLAITDTGLALAVAQRLAEHDPAKYDEAVAKLQVKAQRARERQEEQLRHEKNLRQGKRREKSPPPPPEEGRDLPRQAARRTRKWSRRSPKGTGRTPEGTRKTRRGTPEGSRRGRKRTRKGPGRPGTGLPSLQEGAAARRGQRPLCPRPPREAGQGQQAGRRQARQRQGSQGLSADPIENSPFLRAGLQRGGFIWLWKNTEYTRWRRTSASPPRTSWRS